MKKIGSGIFMWTGSERQSQRYGSFTMNRDTFDEQVQVDNVMDMDASREFLGKRVRIVCKVVESRESGHAGDRFLNVFPSQPEVGEEVEVGVGILAHGHGACGPEWVLEPGDGRSTLWIDPHKLYRLHDQTVETYIEETTAEFSPRTTLKYGDTSGTIANGDGSFQTLTPFTPNSRLKPKIESLGGGIFVRHANFQPGERVETFERTPEQQAVLDEILGRGKP